MGGIHKTNNKIKFIFDEKKATQAAAIFLTLEQEKEQNAEYYGKMAYLKLIKLLYIADRKALKAINKPITGAEYISMEYGPVLSEVLDLIKETKYIKPRLFWFNHILPVNTNQPNDKYFIYLSKSPGTSELSQKEVEIIDRTYKLFGNTDGFSLAEKTHDFPEWRDPLKENKRRLPIDNVTLLKCLGKTHNEIKFIRDMTEIQQEIYELFGQE